MKHYPLVIQFGALILIPAESKDEAEERAEQHPLVKKLTSIPGVWYDGAWATGLEDPQQCAVCEATEPNFFLFDDEKWVCDDCME